MPDDASTFTELLADAVREPPLLIPGTRLAGGRFVVGGLLGTGGMGAVYRATDTRRRLDVAIKVLSRVEAAGIYALKQEFRSLANVRHPNLIALHELHSEDGTWFFSMDLVVGRPLTQLRLTTSAARDVFGQIAAAIAAVHGHGKLHRDLKPSNVLVRPDGRVVVLDFGLVSDREPGGTGQTLAGDGLAGTPTYMAPEQATGRATPPSDWYAFGTMLYEALFGHVPFPTRGLGVLLRKREEPAPAPPALAEVPPALAALCRRLLDRDAAARPGYPEIVAALDVPATTCAEADDPGQDLFVGREPELAALEQALLETDDGHGAVVTISGSPGIGKTQLVQRFLDRVRRELGGVVLSGWCPRWEHVPFRACDSLIDDLSRFLRTLPPERAASVLPRSPHALTQIFPVLSRVPAVQAIKPRRALPADPSEIRRLGIAALRDLLGNLAAQDRLVVFVDDMHWSDVDGARLLGSLVAPADPPDAPALLLVVAYRTQDAGQASGLGTFLARVAANPDLRVRNLRLEALDAAESRRLAVQLLGGPRDGVAERIAADAGGNPLFLRQLSRDALVAETDACSVDLDAVLTRRIARLRPRERTTLAAACLTPRPVPLGLLARIADQPDPEPAARALEAAQLARFASGPADAVTAFHDRIRDVVVASLAPAERLELHARAIEAIEETADPDLAALTLHYLGCGRELEAAACAVKAARGAAMVLAFELAAGMYRLALDVGRWDAAEKVDLLVRLAETLALDHRSGDAGSRFLEAASLEPDAGRRRALRLRAADHYLAGGWFREGIALLREILAEAGLDYDEICSSNLFDLRQRLARRGLVITPRPERAIAPETLARLDALLVAGNGLAWVKAQSVHFRFWLALEAFDAGAARHYACGLRTIARFDVQLDPENEEAYRVLRQLCQADPVLQAEQSLEGPECGMALVRGRPWEQASAGRRTEEVLLRHSVQDARALAVARFHQAAGLYLQGEVHKLHRCWSWLEDARDRNDFFLGSWLNAILAVQHLGHDRVDGAREMCQQAILMWATAEDLGESNLSLCCSEVLGACDVYEGSTEAWEHLTAATSWFERSAFVRIPFLVCQRHGVRARVALACAHEAPTAGLREELLHEAEASIGRTATLRGLDGRAFVLPHYRNLATLLAAGVAAVRGERDAALARLDLALEQLREAGSYSVWSACARRARGVLVGGTEGNGLVARAEGELHRLGIEDPARYSRTVLPGFTARG